MAGSLREINLEEGRPTAERAIRKLTFELNRSVTLGASVVKIIHGYGSSGTGGRIRIEARAYLDRLKKRGDIQDYIPGETFSIFNDATRNAFSACDALRKDRDLERHNNGVTFIVL